MEIYLLFSGYMFSNQVVGNANLSSVNYGSHIGEYIRHKLDSLGIKQRWLSEQLVNSGYAMQRSNLSRILSSKAEMTPSELRMFVDHLPEGFFDEFYSQNPKLKPYQPVPEKSIRDAPERSEFYHVKGSGYRLTLEIDPVDFTPDMVDPLSASLKKALEEFHSQMKMDKKRTK